MPRKIRRPIGTIYEEKTVQTFWDKFVEGAKGVGFVLFVLMLIGLFIG